MIPVNVHGLAVDQSQQQYVVLLNGKGEAADKWLPLRMNPVEAQNIAFQLEGNHPPRPRSHDLMAEITEQLDGDVIEVRLSQAGSRMIEATITVSPPGDREVFELEAGAADAIALALRTGAEMIVEESIMETKQWDLPGAQTGQFPGDPSDLPTEKLKDFSQQLKDAVADEEYETAANIRDQIRDEVRRHQETEELPDEIDEELRRAYGGTDQAEDDAEESESETGQ